MIEAFPGGWPGHQGHGKGPGSLGPKRSEATSPSTTPYRYGERVKELKRDIGRGAALPRPRSGPLASISTVALFVASFTMSDVGPGTYSAKTLASAVDPAPAANGPCLQRHRCTSRPDGATR